MWVKIVLCSISMTDQPRNHQNVPQKRNNCPNQSHHHHSKLMTASRTPSAAADYTCCKAGWNLRGRGATRGMGWWKGNEVWWLREASRAETLSVRSHPSPSLETHDGWGWSVFELGRQMTWIDAGNPEPPGPIAFAFLCDWFRTVLKVPPLD